MSRGRLAARLIAFYVILAAIAVAVVIVVVDQGRTKKAQPVIAGGYDVRAPNACIGSVAPPVKGAPLPPTAPAQPAASGPSFTVQRSGQYVDLTNTQGRSVVSYAFIPTSSPAAVGA